jgi:ppGpp synthetase/RelA/SpoT-type nucleotidyltranferase
VEVQVRTELEHSWARLSEKLSDVVDPTIKYGGGPEPIKSKLRRISEVVGTAETLESRLLTAESRPDEDRESVARNAVEFAEIKQQFKDLLNEMIEQGHLWQDE